MYTTANRCSWTLTNTLTRCFNIIASTYGFWTASVFSISYRSGLPEFFNYFLQFSSVVRPHLVRNLRTVAMKTSCSSVYCSIFTNLKPLAFKLFPFFWLPTLTAQKAANSNIHYRTAILQPAPFPHPIRHLS